MYTKKIIIPIVLIGFCVIAKAENLELDNALRATYTNCVGIDETLHDMKVMAGINTAVTGVGTTLGVGATAVGITKSNLDKAIEQEFETMRNISYAASPDETVDDMETFSSEALEALNHAMSTDGHPVKQAIDDEQEKRKKELTTKSKRNITIIKTRRFGSNQAAFFSYM